MAVNHVDGNVCLIGCDEKLHFISLVSYPLTQNLSLLMKILDNFNNGASYKTPDQQASKLKVIQTKSEEWPQTRGA